MPLIARRTRESQHRCAKEMEENEHLPSTSEHFERVVQMRGGTGLHRFIHLFASWYLYVRITPFCALLCCKYTLRKLTWISGIQAEVQDELRCAKVAATTNRGRHHDIHAQETSKSTLGDQVRELLDRQQIQDTIARYSLGQDSHQDADSAVLQQWDEVFTEDGTVDYSVAGAPLGSYRDLAKWMRGDEARRSYELFLALATHVEPAARYHSRRYRDARTDFYSTHRGRPEQGLNVHYNSPGRFTINWFVRQGWRIRFRRLEVYFAMPCRSPHPSERELAVLDRSDTPVEGERHAAYFVYVCQDVTDARAETYWAKIAQHWKGISPRT